MAFGAVWPEAADAGVAHHLGDVGEHGEVAVARRCPTARRATASSWRTVPTRHGHALPARLVAEEGGDPPHLVDHVDGVVEDEHHAGAERRAPLARALDRQREVEVVRADERAGRPAEQHRPQLGPGAQAAGQLDQLAEREAELDLVDARPFDGAGEAEQLRPSTSVRRVRAPSRGSAARWRASRRC